MAQRTSRLRDGLAALSAACSRASAAVTHERHSRLSRGWRALCVCRSCGLQLVLIELRMHFDAWLAPISLRSACAAAYAVGAGLSRVMRRWQAHAAGVRARSVLRLAGMQRRQAIELRQLVAAVAFARFAESQTAIALRLATRRALQRALTQLRANAYYSVLLVTAAPLHDVGTALLRGVRRWCAYLQAVPPPTITTDSGC